MSPLWIANWIALAAVGVTLGMWIHKIRRNDIDHIHKRLDAIDAKYREDVIALHEKVERLHTEHMNVWHRQGQDG